MKKAVFLDRDGVLNEVALEKGLPVSPATLADVVVYPDVQEPLRELKAAGFVLVMATNQPNVARGCQDRQTVDAINEFLAVKLDLDEIRVCYHDDNDGCSCRKPKAGLLTAAPHYSLPDSYMVGDRWRDVDAGNLAGCHTVWIDRNYSERRPVADCTVKSFTEAAEWILRRTAQVRAHTRSSL